jgi:hypothetical protein
VTYGLTPKNTGLPIEAYRVADINLFFVLLVVVTPFGKFHVVATDKRPPQYRLHL